jgi:rubrerythrin
MSTYITVPGQEKTLVDFDDAKVVETLRGMAQSLAEFEKMMRGTIRSLADHVGAWECEFCGEYTVQAITVESEDEFGRRESAVFCPACGGER